MVSQASDSIEAAPVQVSRQLIALDSISADPKNRTVESDEAFHGLVDSIRVLGVLQPIHVRAGQDGRFELVDGERRWRAAKEAGLNEIACEVWPQDSDLRDARMAGVVLNEQRVAHSPIHVARRLHEIKNDLGLTLEQLSKRSGMPIDRVKSYLALLGASETLQSFFATADVPVKVALEMLRYEKATDPRRTERLTERYAESPLTKHQIAAMRKKLADPEPAAAPKMTATLGARIEKALARDAEAALEQIESALAKFGYGVTMGAGAQGA